MLAARQVALFHDRAQLRLEPHVVAPQVVIESKV